MDLSRWAEDDYYVPLFRRILLRIGAHPYRCEYCRVNFVSFRRRRDRYRRRRSPAEPAQEIAPAEEDDLASTER